MLALRAYCIPATCHHVDTWCHLCTFLTGYDLIWSPVCIWILVQIILQWPQSSCMPSIQYTTLIVYQILCCLCSIIYMELFIQITILIQISQCFQCLLHLWCRAAVYECSVILLYPVTRICTICICKALNIHHVSIQIVAKSHANCTISHLFHKSIHDFL